jgi:hypothetical protein
MRFQGADKISVTARGELALSVGNSRILQRKPLIYQLVAGIPQEIPGGYKMVDAQTVTFAVSHYDPLLPLIIDPILSYSTYFGGTFAQTARAVAINTNDGAIFIAGQTLSKLFTTNGLPFSTNAFQSAFQGGVYVGDAFVARFDSNYNLVYLTYLGGTNEDQANCLAVDKADHAFVGGYTASSDFPVTNISGAYFNGAPYNGVPGIDNQIGGVVRSDTLTYPLDGFVAELDPGGSNLIYSTFLGGSQEDGVESLAIDAADNVYVTGYTFSTNLPVKNPVSFTLLGTTNHFLNQLACTNTYVNCNAFVAKISPLGTNLDYLTYFGGNAFDVGTGIAVDSANNVYVAGYTSSTNFPNTNAFQKFLNNPTSSTNLAYATNSLDFEVDAFVAKFDHTGTNLLYSSFLGSSNVDEAFGLAVDGQGAAYVTGWTTSTNFPNTTPTITNYANGFTNVYYTVINNGLTNITIYGFRTTNAFLTKITQASPTNAAEIAYSVVFGGRDMDVANGVAVDAGNAFVTGMTTSTNFPVKNYLGLLRGTNSSAIVNSFAGYNAFVTAFNTNCSEVLYSAYLGGTGDDCGYGIAVDSADTVYVVGQTCSTNFPTTLASTNFPVYSARYNLLNGVNSRLNGTNDAFLSKILINQYTSSVELTPVLTNRVYTVTNHGVKELATNRVTSALTLAWRAYTEPEIGSFGLESSTNLTTNVWVTVTNLPTTLNSTNYVTLPATNRYNFFRLRQ